MKSRYVLLLIVLFLACNVSNAHRMMMGYKVSELQLMVFYDDGTPAQGAEIEVISDGEMISQGITDRNGTYIIRPEKNVDELTFISKSAGHRARLVLNLSQKGQNDETPLPMRTIAGIGYLVGIAGLAMVYIARRGMRNV
ncbi:MAG: hypothetical protein ABC588_04175 [Candidatus Methanosuratincola petrocarbonis]